MKRFLVCVALTLVASTVTAQNANELVLEQHPFRVYSAFWPNLHHFLYAEAWARRPASEEKQAGPLPEPLKASLTAAERRAWDAAISYYDSEIADLHTLFEQREIRKGLIAVTGEQLPAAGLDPAHRQVLIDAAPVYRKYWWRTHDRANRAWIKETMSKVASLSPAVPDRLARLYGIPWFTTSVRVDVVRVGNREGAYTSNEPAPAHITISSSKPGLKDWMAAEVVFHEASHALVLPIMQAFAAELRAQGKTSRDLWHASLFYLTGEVVRQALASRGTVYEPYLYKTGLFDRVWAGYKSAIEIHWKPYVNGEVSKETAIKNIVSAIK